MTGLRSLRLRLLLAGAVGVVMAAVFVVDVAVLAMRRVEEIGVNLSDPAEIETAAPDVE